MPNNHTHQLTIKNRACRVIKRCLLIFKHRTSAIPKLQGTPREELYMSVPELPPEHLRRAMIDRHIVLLGSSGTGKISPRQPDEVRDSAASKS